jgi:methylenetetrahydrofolate reductase (NADPH)
MIPVRHLGAANQTVHNDFHVTHGIFSLFDGLKVQDMDKPLHTTGALNGDSNENGNTIDIGEKSKVEAASDAVKSAASAITNGLNGLKVN